jgi:hypothetical protein
LPWSRRDGILETMMPLFDAYAGFGAAKREVRRVVTREDWLAEMARLQIGRALVRPAPDEFVRHPEDGNSNILQECRGIPELTPCLLLVPSNLDDMPSDGEQVSRLLSCGAGFGCIRPRRDNWALEEWVCEAMLSELETHRVPLLCPDEEVPLVEVAKLAARLPGLPLVMAGTNLRSMRTLVPLMKRFGNTFLVAGGVWAAHDGIECLVRDVGAHRLLFGTGYPSVEPMAAVTLLMYSRISDADKRKIGAENLGALLEGVRR